MKTFEGRKRQYNKVGGGNVKLSRNLIPYQAISFVDINHTNHVKSQLRLGKHPDLRLGKHSPVYDPPSSYFHTFLALLNPAIRNPSVSKPQLSVHQIEN
ncbi:hypothetical protein L1987_42146 [Smallanthus sonchifolius]|uniref:Uncharacterized protein n=1 Tax=Smallanthus sonchifolius TaxID=185202 RepID=A0ACB9GWV8_9ASTR|nr:hypothetical protein L1987_42146 [Smallanthus sonchifolius]